MTQFFSLLPGYSGYREKIPTYWDIEKKFAFFRFQYVIGCRLCNDIN
jgi:hypothetical protein